MAFAVRWPDVVLEDKMAALLEVRNLTIGFRKEKEILTAVDNISFSINEGEIIGLAGESGCGKSTTALSITNLLPQAAQILNGEIIFNNQPITCMNEKDLRHIRGEKISMIFQDGRQSLNPLIKVGSQIIEMLELNNELLADNKKQKTKNKSAALEILVSLGFDKPEKIFNAYPHQLSGGMCQRVLAAIASICRPRLLLADEPSSALDEESENNLFSLLLEMNRVNKTSILIISHDLSIIRQYCSRFLIMYAGKIVEEGHADTLFSPLHPYTQALINAIPGKDKRGKKLESIPGKVPSIEDNLTGCPFAARCKKVQNICYEAFPPDYFCDKRKTNNEFEDTEKDVIKRVYCYYPEKGEENP
jgi:peptide/nickel transport system ATP-binding protein